MCIYIYIHASSFFRWFLGRRTVKPQYSKGFALGVAMWVPYVCAKWALCKQPPVHLIRVQTTSEVDTKNVLIEFTWIIKNLRCNGTFRFHRWALLVQKQRFFWTCRGNMGKQHVRSSWILSSPDAQQSSGSKVNISLNFTWNFLSRVQSRTVVRKNARGGHETSTLLLGTGSKAIQT